MHQHPFLAESHQFQVSKLHPPHWLEGPSTSRLASCPSITRAHMQLLHSFASSLFICSFYTRLHLPPPFTSSTLAYIFYTITCTNACAIIDYVFTGEHPINSDPIATIALHYCLGVDACACARSAVMAPLPDGHAGGYKEPAVHPPALILHS